MPPPWGPPGGPPHHHPHPGPFGCVGFLFDGVCRLFSTCAYVLCCCCLLESCCGPIFHGPGGPPHGPHHH
ncbi:hypothetical protein MLD38_020664 [Melastoma candidum]|uniref:Uncharacterized protein n=1 Tax=Melastoma candidum TaxID=119954 RepID=A0ACB9QD07_9MYRT|nr:hypothetical protein MLD38_020664 [Melastoma candidum]